MATPPSHRNMAEDAQTMLWQMYDTESRGFISYSAVQTLVRDLYRRERPDAYLSDAAIQRACAILGVAPCQELNQRTFFNRFGNFWTQRVELLSTKNLAAESSKLDLVASMRFRPGDVYSTLAPAEVLADEDPMSSTVCSLPPGSWVELVRVGFGDAGQIFVKTEAGLEGWVRVVRESGEPLIGPTRRPVEPGSNEMYLRAIEAGADIASELCATHERAHGDSEELFRCRVALNQAKARCANDACSISDRGFAVQELCADVTKKLQRCVIDELKEAKTLREQAAKALDAGMLGRARVAQQEAALQEKLAAFDDRNADVTAPLQKQFFYVLEEEKREVEREAYEASIEMKKAEQMYWEVQLEREQVIQEAADARSHASNSYDVFSRAKADRSYFETEVRQVERDRLAVDRERARIVKESEEAQWAATESMEVYRRAKEDRVRVEAEVRQAALDLEVTAAGGGSTAAAKVEVRALRRELDDEVRARHRDGEALHEFKMVQKRLSDETVACLSARTDRDRLQRELRDLSRLRR